MVSRVAVSEVWRVSLLVRVAVVVAVEWEWVVI